MNRHRLLDNFTLFAISLSLDVSLVDIDAVNQYQILLWHRLEDLAFLALVLAGNHYYVFVFFYVHWSMVMVSLYDFWGQRSDLLETLFRDFSRDRTEDTAADWLHLFSLDDHHSVLIESDV